MSIQNMFDSVLGKFDSFLGDPLGALEDSLPTLGTVMKKQYEEDDIEFNRRLSHYNDGIKSTPDINVRPRDTSPAKGYSPDQILDQWRTRLNDFAYVGNASNTTYTKRGVNQTKHR